MSLNPKYIVAPALQQHFTDKDTGDFLRGGYVLFFKDNARTIGKPVYQLVGAPPNYTYIEYGYYDTNGAWRIDLNEQGAFDHIVYWYPYDENGNLDLYFVQVFSSNDSVFPLPGIEQFSVQAYPNIASGSTPIGTVIDVNYIPNGQLLLHNELPKTQTYKENQIRDGITPIAYGGFTFERPNSSTATDFVTFPRFGSYVSSPSASPRYAVRVECQIPNPGDTYKDIRIKFDDVNKFSSQDPSVQYTFSFNGRTNNGSSLQVQFLLYKNYGSGGSLPTETSIQQFILTSSYQNFSGSFSFGDNSSKSIGSNDDDYLQLVIRFPTSFIFDASFTDFILTDGAVTQPLFPETPDSEFVYQGLAGYFPIPDPLGFDIGLPPILTKTGWSYDDSEVGLISASPNKTAPFGYLVCDGTQYKTSDYSSDGIPYARLQKKLYDNTLNFPIFGTGENYATVAPLDGDTSTLQFNTNKIGAVTAPADGTAATGFTFFNTYISGSDYYCQGLYRGTNLCYIWNNEEGATNAASAGTSGFTISSGEPRFPSPLVRQVTEIETIAATTLAGKYFSFNTWNSGANQSWYMWFTVDGSGTDPAPGGTGIKVDLKSTDTANEVAQAVTLAASGFEIDRITFLAGSSVPASSYWTFDVVGQGYYVWYTLDGVGTDPDILNKIGIKVDVLSADTAAQVAQKTQIAINSLYFSVPDLRGLFIRGWDNGANIDPIENAINQSIRWSYNTLIYADEIASLELDQVQSHRHNFGATPSGQIAQSGNPWNVPNETETDFAGGAESRPINMALNYVIKY